MENRKLTWQMAGGAARAISQRKEAIERYMKSPNLCEFCGSPILVRNHERVPEVRKKKYCSHSCAAKHNNLAQKGRSVPRANPTCKVCHKPFRGRATGKICEACRKLGGVGSVSKGVMFQKRTNWQSARSSIQKHAKAVYRESGKPKVCLICGYSTYVEIAHIKAVSSFGDEIRILEINHSDNLIALCPNHHWEFDHGLLPINGSEGRI